MFIRQVISLGLGTCQQFLESQSDILLWFNDSCLEVDKLVFETSDSDMSLTLIRIQTKNQIRAQRPANSTYLEPRCQVELCSTALPLLLPLLPACLLNIVQIKVRPIKRIVIQHLVLLIVLQPLWCGQYDQGPNAPLTLKPVIVDTDRSHCWHNVTMYNLTQRNKIRSNLKECVGRTEGPQGVRAWPAVAANKIIV